MQERRDSGQQRGRNGGVAAGEERYRKGGMQESGVFIRGGTQERRDAEKEGLQERRDEGQKKNVPVCLMAFELRVNKQ